MTYKELILMLPPSLVLLSSPALARYTPHADRFIASHPTVLFINNLFGAIVALIMFGIFVYGFCQVGKTKRQSTGEPLEISVPPNQNSDIPAAGSAATIDRHAPSPPVKSASGGIACLTMLLCAPMSLVGFLSVILVYDTGGIMASIIALGIGILPLGLLVPVLRAFFQSRR